MTDDKAGATGGELTGLQSSKSIHRLRQISNLRAHGISDNIDLPQLVVCGDQSAGKSSVLEGVTGIPFPRDEGVCTKFATEVILEHAEGALLVTATIIPHSLRDDKDKLKLQAFHRTIKGFDDLPDVIAKAGTLMGLRGYGDNDTGPSFTEDVLRIKVIGPSGLHLSIVDLPGIISVASEEQTEADVETVQRMVDSYVAKPRIIILAVVQASNDIANQSIIKKSKQYDVVGQRTVGIITKPDLINIGAERRIAALAKNQDTTKLQLGFYMLKNPTPKEREGGITQPQRAENELRYFRASPWAEQKLDYSRVGIDRLKLAMQSLLEQHIEKELPKVKEEIRAAIRDAESRISSLPPERPTTAHIRFFLSDIAMQFHSLANAALGGDYHTSSAPFFANDTPGAEIPASRLRAVVHDLNTKFADRMRKYGETVKIDNTRYVTNSPSARPSKRSKLSTAQASDGPPVLPMDSRKTLDLEDVSGETEFVSENGQRVVNEAGLRDWVKKVYLTSRGRELPGHTNHALGTELFHQQSKRWLPFATEHVERVYGYVVTFVGKAIKYLKVEGHVMAEIKEIIDIALDKSKSAAEEELTRLWADEEQQQPITYNHYYTDNVQKSRSKRNRASKKKLLGGFEGGADDVVEPAAITDGMDDETLSAGSQDIQVDMVEQACSQALDELDSYYKTARKTFVDNVCKQVIERHLLRHLPAAFSPQSVAMYSDEELQRIAGEKSDIVETRKQLQEQLVSLNAALAELRK
ncbi:hypothetical protein BAUCODRAFT_26966 [Baudoinia panamericana UAMH 10762]|uniref:GED domain-containing protein n=1 Tax=Baudoinia panamericana (strain UAMH 10762) TaxID=717646 RepID=M2LEZ3_BAUPA|nr:uncharacterized protein BAUCODRAFT_26966 [Baudoinia panamericana UAMH 10762]EMC92587.1 hypothetical protein BAUCODRAFT_26966 [Baudoinia panamericana UAMH 10762]